MALFSRRGKLHQELQASYWRTCTNSTPCGTAQPHLLLQNCFFLSAPFLSTHKTMGKHSPLTNILGNHRTCSFYWSIPSRGTTVSKNAHHSPSKCNDGVTWYCIPREEKLELQLCSQDSVLPYTSRECPTESKTLSNRNYYTSKFDKREYSFKYEF